ncbi:MAG TPA: nuclear transport factor 2 family protein [Pyrinomonadaceae bacterium]|jgi:ketosteroid isomerase-like protein|nr:nuclear transport factor 2 family protein [Pyrinomonadaceae bacterium]
MKGSSILVLVLVLTIASSAALAQNSNSAAPVRPRTTGTPAPSGTPARQTSSTDVQQPASKAPAASRTPAKPKITGGETPGSQSVIAAFNALVNGIRHADAKAVAGVYLNSPRLLLFNNNGTVTRGWDQMRKNRESSYADVKDVKLDVRDVSITMLGRDGAIVTCLWTQSQTYKGTPETATGRMTLVFKRIGKDWKAIHVHTSPDKPDPSRVMPSEQASPTSAPVTPNP